MVYSTSPCCESKEAQHNLGIMFDCAAKHQWASLNDVVVQGPDLTNNYKIVIQCLTNKTVHYIVDSTIRNLYFWEMTHLPIKHEEMDWSTGRYFHNTGSMISQNIRLNYVFHYCPFKLAYHIIVNSCQCQQEKQYTDSIDTKGYVGLVASLLAHVTILCRH